jgi:hypothetical protein
MRKGKTLKYIYIFQGASSPLGREKKRKMMVK